MVQSVKHLTLDFSSGLSSSHDLTVHEVGLLADSAEAAWDSLCAPPLLMLVITLSLSLSLSLKMNKYFLKR